MSWIAGLPERIADRISPEPNSGCWLWTGCDTGQGYGGVYWSGKQHRAHRLVYEFLRGPIPQGLVTDHLCRVRCCVNPDHLEPVTIQENTRRGISFRRGLYQRALKTHCLRGHPFSGDNLFVKANGSRRCRACHRLHNQTFIRSPESREQRNRAKRLKRQALRALRPPRPPRKRKAFSIPNNPLAAAEALLKNFPAEDLGEILHHLIKAKAA